MAACYMALPTTTNMQRQIDSNGRIIRRRSPRERTNIMASAPSLIITTPPTTAAMVADHHRYMADNNKYSGNGSILLDGVIRLQITDRTNDKRLQNITSVIVQSSTLSRNKNKRRCRHTHCIFTYRSVVDVYIISACLMSSIGSVVAVAHGEERVLLLMLFVGGEVKKWTVCCRAL